MTAIFYKLPLVLCCFLVASPAVLWSADPTYRTDTGDAKLPWFKLVPSQFPPEGSAHYIGGELIGVDHINRTGTLRIDRTDAIRRGEWDRPLAFTMLPYGSLSYHGAPAELRDIPIGTHLHGYFYVEEKTTAKTAVPVFDRAIRLDDDFSFYVRQQRAWRVDDVDVNKGTLTVTGVGVNGAQSQADAKPTAFQINAATRVWKGHAIAALTDLAARQVLQVNLTFCTLKGPGRCTDIWIDDEARQIATAQQAEVHRQYLREHGLAGWIDEVDNEQGIVTVTLFAGFDAQLKREFAASDGLAAAVAEENLRTYDQGSDRMRGELVDVQATSAGTGSSGVRVRLKPVTLLEGFRPGRIIRLFSGKWRVDDIPKEERIYQ